MKFKILSLVGYTFLFFLHSALSLPSNLQKLSAVETLIKDNSPVYSALKNLSRRTYKTKTNYIQGNVLPSGYYDISECNGSDIVSAYKFHSTRKTWHDARRACNAEGGFLAYPECPEEGQKYREILQRVNKGGAWIGLNDPYEEGEWLTVFDNNVNELQYIKWAENQPDTDDDDGEHCAQLSEDGLWYNKQCRKEFFFFCKIDIYPSGTI